jgi:hypothetical protein
MQFHELHFKEANLPAKYISSDRVANIGAVKPFSQINAQIHVLQLVFTLDPLHINRRLWLFDDASS